jgi:hypothetical protein
MSLFGCMHKHMNDVLEVLFEINRTILDSWDITKKLENRNGHHLHHFRVKELRILLESNNFGVVSISA